MVEPILWTAGLKEVDEVVKHFNATVFICRIVDVGAEEGGRQVGDHVLDNSGAVLLGSRDGGGPVEDRCKVWIIHVGTKGCKVHRDGILCCVGVLGKRGQRRLGCRRSG